MKWRNIRGFEIPEFEYEPLIEKSYGKYLEMLYKLSDGTTSLNRYCNRKTGSIVFRRAEDIHRVVVDNALPIERKKEAVLSVCFIGPREQEWSFYDKDLVIPWTEFLNIDRSHKNWEGHE